MTTLFKVAAACCALGLLSAQAADFSDNSVGLHYGTRFSNPGTNDNNIHRTILSFTHFSVDKLGTNFFTADLLKSGSNEPTVGGGGAQELYGLYSRNWSYGKVSGGAGGPRR
ncbi:MAG: hypothetical protein ACRECD_09325 [Burkholderiaceae bacterium]